jgi:hypothetical protein
MRAPNLYLVSVEVLEEPILAIPNLSGESGDFIFVRLLQIAWLIPPSLPRGTIIRTH